jgi:peptidoglycan-N-acetylglucosamine deacetylase
MMEMLNRLFEVLTLESDGESFYMLGRAKIKDDSAQFQLQIDKQIYQQLNGHVSSDGHSRCRLSLQSNWDPFLQHHFGKISRFYGQQSDDIYFRFSDDFLNTLTQLKDITELKQLGLIDNLSFMGDSCLKTAENKQGSGKLVFLHTLPFVCHVLAWPVVSGLLFLSAAYAGRHELQPTALNSIVVDDHTSDDIEFYSEIIAEVATYYETPAEGEVPASEVANEVSVSSPELKNPVETGIPEGYVALSFDDGPSKYTKEIIDILSEHQVHATFFFVGKNALKYPDEVKYAILREMSVQNHSWSHRNMKKLPLHEQMEDIFKTNELLTSLTDEPVTLFRPPYGSKTQRLAEELVQEQMRIMMWNRDPKDWKAKNSKEIIQYVLKTKPSGGVYLFHENKRTVDALPRIIEYLKEADVEFIVLK